MSHQTGRRSQLSRSFNVDMTSFLVSVLVLTVACVVVGAETREGEKCSLPLSGTSGVCIHISKCPPVLQAALEGSSPEKICFHIGTVSVVCCDSSSIAPDNLEIPVIDNHKNAGLLPDICGKSSLDRDFPSYKNNKTTAKEFPWTALISTKRAGSDEQEFSCSGTIISARYILTAAHCVTGKEHRRTLGRVRVGTRRTIDSECDITKSGAACSPKVQNIEIETLIPHSGFIGKITNSIQEVRDDIALIRLKEPIDLDNEFSMPVCLPKEYHWLNGIVGLHRQSWGLGKVGRGGELLLSDSKSSDKYLKFEESKAPNEICKEKILKGSMGGADGCHRTSGDPNLERRNEHGYVNYIQHGILIGAAPCHGGDDYGLYTSVDFYMKWILDNLLP